MIEKSLYEDYQIDFSDTYRSDDAHYFIFNNERELHLTEDKTLPDNLDNFDSDFVLYIGKYKGKEIFVCNVCEGDSFFNLKEVYDMDHDLYLMAGKAVLVRDWYISHQFCGRCGTGTVIDEKDIKNFVLNNFIFYSHGRRMDDGNNVSVGFKMVEDENSNIKPYMNFGYISIIHNTDDTEKEIF